MSQHLDARPVWLAIDWGSPVGQLYERHGLTYQHDDPNGVDRLFRKERVPELAAAGLP